MSARFHNLASGRTRGVVAATARSGLWLASLGYRLGSRIRNVFYDHKWLAITKAAVPVVSVGNLTLGGTGKTPCVEFIARYFRKREVRVTILSRGYGSTTGPNDEALVLEENLPDVPHLQGKDRVALAATAIEELETELIILDDGFQHRRLARDLDIVLVDATNPWGHGYMFPRGLLRESKRALRRADIVIMTRCDQVEDVAGLQRQIAKRVRADVPIIVSTHQPLAWQRHQHGEVPADAWAGRWAGAFCGLGNPDSFLRTLQKLGIEIRQWRTFPDHHNYGRTDVNDLRNWAEGLPKDALVLTTQKDAVKLRLTELASRPLWALRIGLQVKESNETDELFRRLENVLQGKT
jgi:tetraacyldisaccharide 4'-kinase